MEFKDYVPWIISAIAVGISLSVFIYTRRRNKELDQRADKSKTDEKIEKMKDEIAEVDKRIAIIEAQLSVFFRVIETQSAKGLHAPIHQRRDELLDKLMGKRKPPLNMEEVDELSREMQAIIDAPDERIPGERMYAILMQARLEAKKAKDRVLRIEKSRASDNRC